MATVTVKPKPIEAATYVSKEEFKKVAASLEPIDSPEAKANEQKALEFLRKMRGW